MYVFFIWLFQKWLQTISRFLHGIVELWKIMRKMCSFKCKETSKFILVALYWKYVHSSTRRKIKAGKKNLNVKIFNLQYDAMGYTTYSFYLLHKNVPFRNGRNTSRLSNVWKENFWYSGYMYFNMCLIVWKNSNEILFLSIEPNNVQFLQIYELYGLIDFMFVF